MQRESSPSVTDHEAIDYEAVDVDTGHKHVDLFIWNSYKQDILLNEDPPDASQWALDFAEDHQLDVNKVRSVVLVGVYSGPRDEFHQRCGRGRALYPNGDTYEGEFLDGLKHGTGHYIFVSQGKSDVDARLEMFLADTELENDQKIQRAKEVAQNLKIGVEIVLIVMQYGVFPFYHGEYIHGRRSGQGLMKNQDGSVYKGVFRDGLRHGRGIFYYVNGDSFTGEWHQGKKNGFGVYRFAHGGEYRGEWRQGQFVEGQWIMVDGVYYEGKFDAKNKPRDVRARMHFPHLKTSVSGVALCGRWEPQVAYAADAEVPADESAWVGCE